MATAARPRFAGEEEAVATALRPHVVGVKWLRYGETRTAKVQSTTSLQHRTLAAVLLRLQGSLSFARVQLECCVAVLRSEGRDTWAKPLLPTRTGARRWRKGWECCCGKCNQLVCTVLAG